MPGAADAAYVYSAVVMHGRHALLGFLSVFSRPLWRWLVMCRGAAQSHIYIDVVHWHRDIRSVAVCVGRFDDWASEIAVNS